MPCQNVVNGEKCKGGYSYEKSVGLIVCGTCGHVKP